MRPIVSRAAGNVAGPVPPVAQDDAADVTGFVQGNPTGAVQGVSVIRSETHLAPSIPPAARRQVNGRVAADAISRDAQASADAVGAPVEEGRPSARHSIVAAARSKDGGQWPAQGSPGRAPAPQVALQARAPAAEAGSQPQVTSAEDASLNASPASRSAGQSAAAGQEAPPPAQPPSSPVQQIADRIAADIAPTSEHRRADPVVSLPTTSDGAAAQGADRAAASRRAWRRHRSASPSRTTPSSCRSRPTAATRPALSMPTGRRSRACCGRPGTPSRP